MTRCRKLSLVGASPETSRPSWSSFDSRAGSSRPSEALVGVISQPSSVRTLMLPDDPAVSPRSKIDAPIAQIASRCVASLIWFLPASHGTAGVFAVLCSESSAVKISSRRWRLRQDSMGRVFVNSTNAFLAITGDGSSFLSGKDGKGAQEEVGRAEIAGFERQRQRRLAEARTVHGTPGSICRPMRSPVTPSACTTAPAVSPPATTKPPHAACDETARDRRQDVSSTSAPARSRPSTSLHRGDLVGRRGRARSGPAVAEQRRRPVERLLGDVAACRRRERVDREHRRPFAHMGDLAARRLRARPGQHRRRARDRRAAHRRRRRRRAGPGGGNSPAARARCPTRR